MERRRAGGAPRRVGVGRRRRDRCAAEGECGEGGASPILWLHFGQRILANRHDVLRRLVVARVVLARRVAAAEPEQRRDREAPPPGVVRCGAATSCAAAGWSSAPFDLMRVSEKRRDGPRRRVGADRDCELRRPATRKSRGRPATKGA